MSDKARVSGAARPSVRTCRRLAALSGLISTAAIAQVRYFQELQPRPVSPAAYNLRELHYGRRFGQNITYLLPRERGSHPLLAVVGKAGDFRSAGPCDARWLASWAERRNVVLALIADDDLAEPDVARDTMFGLRTLIQAKADRIDPRRVFLLGTGRAARIALRITTDPDMGADAKLMPGGINGTILLNGEPPRSWARQDTNPLVAETASGLHSSRLLFIDAGAEPVAADWAKRTADALVQQGADARYERTAALMCRSKQSQLGGDNPPTRALEAFIGLARSSTSRR